MSNSFEVTEDNINETKYRMKYFVNGVSLLRNYLNNDLEASYILLSASIKNIEKLKENCRNCNVTFEVYDKLNNKLIDLQNELASHIYLLDHN
ncbi:MAG: hypothetical protein DCC88_00415 [Spirobacillus cienkowskii]|jgi:hypothetical protein|uniref:Uncharacterized protein n=1 Tax=Spirobacillus cienkowskii TaxID=495820 RepID=A0A369L0C2_9BACT|nr:MAG: hypothetical protein DCC88_00415 [Spirobacillus cienkowskii]